MRTFRPEIQLLRAIAVLAVVVYHFVPKVLPGGFVGVDVFFVISGFLITSHMLKEAERTGALSLTKFWANRAKRILPAATVVILATIAGTIAFLPPSQFENVTRQAIASAFYFQNFALAAQSVDYLRQSEAPTPFQHFWSLSVEEQFYLFWPLLVVAALWIVTSGKLGVGHQNKFFSRRLRLVAFVLFLAVCVVSFIWSVSAVNASNPAAYFITPTRVWELGVGGLVACCLGDPQRAPGVRKVLAWVGLGLIAIACFVYSAEATPFPGATALVPVVGAVLVIVAGETRGKWSLAPVVNFKPVELTGLWSYSLYLWHFPVVVFYTAFNGAESIKVWDFLALTGVSFGLAILSYYVIEQPMRNLAYFKRSHIRPLVGAGAAVALTAGFAVAPYWKYQVSIASEQTATERLLSNPRLPIGAASLKADSFERYVRGNDGVIVPSLAIANKDTPKFPCEGVPAKIGEAVTKECVVANEAGTKTLAVVGDSHAAQWVPALEKVVEGTDWRLVAFIHNSCPFSFAPRGIETKGKSTCTEPNRLTTENLVKMKPDRVVVANLAVKDFGRVSGEAVPGTTGYVNAWKPLSDAGIPITVLHATPFTGSKESIPDCVSSNLTEGDLTTCDLKRADVQHMSGVNAALKAAVDQTPGAEFVDMTDQFCTDSVCPAVVGNVTVYRDANHITATYIRTVADELGKRLRLNRK